VAIATDLGNQGFSFDVTSDSPWLFGYVTPGQGNQATLRVGVSARPAGTYDGVLTVRLNGIQNLQKTLAVHYVVDPAAAIQASVTSVTLHVVKGRPAPTVSVSVTGSVPGVSWSFFPIGGYPSFLSFSQTATTTPGELRITADVAAPLGIWGFTVLLDGENGQRIQVNGLADVSSGEPFDITPDAIDATFTRGGSNGPGASVVTFVAPAATAVQWSTDQNWILTRQGSGTTPFATQLPFDTTLPEGVYHATLTARGGGAVKTMAITWRLFDAPRLVFPTTPIHFTYQIGGAQPAAQQIQITSPTLNPGFFESIYQLSGWLSVDPLFGRTPATLTLSVNAQGLAPGTYKTDLSIDGGIPDRNAYPPIPIALDVLPDPNAPTSSLSAVVDAASFLGGAVSPGEIVTLYGSGMGPASVVGASPDPTGSFPTSLGGATFFFDEIAAPVLYLSATQAAVVAPFAIGGRERTKITVETGGRRSLPLTAAVSAANPAVFTADSSGAGLAAALNAEADGSVTRHGAANPAARGAIVILYATGLGTTRPALADGKVTSGPLPSLAAGVSVRVGGLPGEVLYAGPAPGLIAGLMQINVRIPDGAPAGEAAVLVIAGDSASQPGVKLSIR
jgi:uncharacterized protein (TIGR03437 family)